MSKSETARLYSRSKYGMPKKEIGRILRKALRHIRRVGLLQTGEFYARNPSGRYNRSGKCCLRGALRLNGTGYFTPVVRLLVDKLPKAPDGSERIAYYNDHQDAKVFLKTIRDIERSCR